MGPGNQGRVSPVLWRVLAGIECGIVGGLVMAAWFSLSSALDVHSLWIVPNFWGSVLSRQPVLTSAFGWVTVAGLGLQLSIAGGIGALFGIVTGDVQNRLRVILFGVLAGLVWYYAAQGLLAIRLGILAGVYAPPRTMLLGHLVFGMSLGRFPGRLRSLGAALAGESAGSADSHETAAAPDAVK